MAALERIADVPDLVGLAQCKSMPKSAKTEVYVGGGWQVVAFFIATENAHLGTG